LLLTTKAKTFFLLFIGSLILAALLFAGGFYCGIRKGGNTDGQASTIKRDLESARQSNAELRKQLEQQRLDYTRIAGDKDELRAENQRLGDTVKRLEEFQQSDRESMGTIGEIIKRGRAVTNSLTKAD
jgi:hypothetical protein